MKKWLVIALVSILLLALAVVVAVSAQEGGREQPAVEISVESVEINPDWEDEPGILITGIGKDSPAAEAGLRRGDIILQVDGEEVNTPDEVRELIREMEPADTVTLSVLRCDEPENVVVTLGELDKSGRGYLGVDMFRSVRPGFVISGPLTRSIEIEREFILGDGALVVVVEEDTPASAAGLQEGDRITAVDGEEVIPDRPLPDIIRSKAIGDRVELLVERGNEEVTLDATLAEHPEEDGIAYLGVRIAPVPWGLQMMPSFGRGFFHDLERGASLSGALVADVEEGSPAEQVGIQEGDLITAVDGEPVDHPHALVEMVRARQPGDEVGLAVLRDGEEMTFSVTLGSALSDDGEIGYLGVEVHAFMRWEGSLKESPRRAPFWTEDSEFEFHFPWLDLDDFDWRHEFRFPPPDLDDLDWRHFELPESIKPPVVSSSQA